MTPAPTTPILDADTQATVQAIIKRQASTLLTMDAHAYLLNLYGLPSQALALREIQRQLNVLRSQLAEALPGPEETPL